MRLALRKRMLKVNHRLDAHPILATQGSATFQFTKLQLFILSTFYVTHTFLTFSVSTGYV